MVYQGPVRPTTDVERFRRTGESFSGGGVISGPVRPTTDEEIFRQTGQSVPIGSQEAIRIRAELTAQAEQQKQQERQQIDLRTQQQIGDIQRQSQEQLRGIGSISERTILQQEQRKQIEEAKRQGTLEKVERGLVTGGIITTAEGGRARVSLIGKIPQEKVSVTGQIKAPETTGFWKSLWGTGLIGVGGKTGNLFISKGVEKIKEFEEAKAGKPKPDWAKKFETIAERILGAKVSPDKDRKTILPTGSITQKYYELFGAKFYVEGEREQRVVEGLKNFTTAQDYEEQQEAIKQLKSQGINVIRQGDNYKIDTKQALKKFAPTSKIGNILVGLTDIYVKARIFAPYMQTGAVKKGTAKVKPKQEIVYKRKFSDLSDAEYSNIINKIRIKTSPQELRNAYSKALRSGNKNLISDTEKILKDVMGKQGASTLVRDVQAQEGFVSSSAKTGKLTLEVEVGELFNIKALPTTSTLTSTDVLTGQKDLFIQKDVGRFQDTTGISKYPSQVSTRVESLGVLGKFDTQQKEAQKNILGLKTKQELKIQQKELLKQQELLRTKQGVKEALALSSLLSQKQALKQKSIQRLAQQLKQATKQKPTLKYPKPLIFGLGLGGALKKVKERIKTKGDGEFDVFVRKFKKDVKIGDDLQFPEAKKLLKDRLEKTLRASGHITSDITGEKVRVNLGFGFTPSKIDPLRVVQQRGRRLSTMGERKEIVWFKKQSKGKGKSKLDWFS